MSDARENARIPEDSDHRGHGIGDSESRTVREEREPARESTEVTRTSRSGSGSNGDRSPRGSREDDDGRDPIPGNTSETGVGSPVSNGTVGRSSGRTSIGPPMGCTRTAAMLALVLTTVVSALRAFKR